MNDGSVCHSGIKFFEKDSFLLKQTRHVTLIA